MTLKTSSNRRKTEFFQTYLWVLKKNRGFAALFALLLFLAFPMILMLTLRNSNFLLGGQGPALTYTTFSRTLLAALVTPLTMLFVIIQSAQLFGYLHQKRSVDFFHALPVGRVPMLTARYCAGLTLVILPSLLNFLIASAAGFSYGAGMEAAGVFLLTSLLWLWLMSAAALGFCMLMAVCTGTTADMVISILGVSAAYPLLIFLGNTFASEILPGLAMSLAENTTVLTAFSPFAASILPFISLYQQPVSQTWPFLIWWIALTLIFTGAAVLLYRKRRSECAESGFAFALPKIIIRFLLTAAGGLGLGLILQQSSPNNGTGNFLIGATAGSFAAHIVTEVVYARGFRQLRKSFVHYGVFAALFAACYLSLSTGFFGYDTRVPNADSVESITVDSPIWESERIYGEKNYQTVGRVVPEVRERENIEKVVQLHRTYVTDLKEAGAFYHLQPYSSLSFTIAYHKRNGTVFRRSYGAGTDASATFYDSIQQLPEYRRSGSLLPYLDADYIDHFELTGSGGETESITPDPSGKAELLAAMQQDYTDGKLDKYGPSKTKTYATISLSLKDSILPKDGSRFKALVGGYSGRVRLDNPVYLLTDASGATDKILKQYGWEKS